MYRDNNIMVSNSFFARQHLLAYSCMLVLLVGLSGHCFNYHQHHNIGMSIANITGTCNISQHTPVQYSYCRIARGMAIGAGDVLAPIILFTPSI